MVRARSVVSFFAVAGALFGLSAARAQQPVVAVQHVARMPNTAIDGGAALAGYTVYVMTLHYTACGDMFSSFYPDNFRATFEAYKDIGFDGSALDEFRYLTIGRGTKEDFRERMYTPAMAKYFKQHTGKELARTLFDMRYAPANDPAPRIWAIDHYFDTLRQGPLLVEQRFAADTTAVARCTRTDRWC